MISLDPRRYDDFKNIYMDTVYDLICSRGKRDSKTFKKSRLHFPGTESALGREMAWYLLDYGLYSVLTVAGTGFEGMCVPKATEISTMTDEALKDALRPLILGSVETLRKARSLLLSPQEDPKEEEKRGEGFSKEIQDALAEQGLMFNNENWQICHALDKGTEKDANLLNYIPYNKEKEVRKDSRGYRKQADDKTLKIYELLDRRWDVLDYLYHNVYDALRDKEPVCSDDLQWKDMSVSACLVTLLELRSCPYCNRNYIGTMWGKNLGYQLDHYINKSMYPLFCLSLYNLVPSCSVCNHGKSDDDETEVLSPFEEGPDYENDLDFYYVPPLRAKEEHGYIKIEVKDKVGKDKARRYEKTIEAFELNKCYKFNTTEADNFIQKMIYYPSSMISEMGRIMSKSGNSLLEERMIEAAMFGEGMKEVEEYHNHPLSMMYSHLYRKYRE